MDAQRRAEVASAYKAWMDGEDNSVSTGTGIQLMETLIATMRGVKMWNDGGHAIAASYRVLAEYWDHGIDVDGRATEALIQEMDKIGF